MALSAVSDVLIRPADEGDDVAFLERVLCWAAGWRSDEPDESALAEPAVRRYVDAWGRAGDVAVIAESPEGEPVGAAWYRLFSPEDESYGFVDEETPEVTLGVEPAHRGVGVGRALLEALAESARADGYSRLSLSVEEDNPAVRLYERVGFERRDHKAGAWTLVLPLA